MSLIRKCNESVAVLRTLALEHPLMLLRTDVLFAGSKKIQLTR